MSCYWLQDQVPRGSKKDTPSSQRQIDTLFGTDLNYIQDIDNIWRNRFQKSEIFSGKDINGELITTIEAELLKERIQKLNQEFQTDMLQYNTTVHAAVESYLRMGKHLGNVFALAEFYFPLFEKILSKYNIPKELKYLAIVESNLNAKATSRTGAQGLWQFMPQTGRLYALQKTEIYDDRNDPIKATEAACQYLKDLYDRIGDWALVLASYNAGPGTIERALQHSGSKKDFWSLQSYLPIETRNYVPKFIAVSYVLNYYKEHNILPEQSHLKYDQTELIPVNKKVSLNLLAQELNLSREKLNFLNPQYFLGIVPEGGQFLLRLPKDKIALFEQKEKALYDQGKNLTDPILNPKRQKKKLKKVKKRKILLASSKSQKKEKNKPLSRKTKKTNNKAPKIEQTKRLQNFIKKKARPPLE
ncbi:MAG: lytic transglycosylase domain-containing protein [Flavobacteriales bacterium Tduv]